MPDPRVQGCNATRLSTPRSSVPFSATCAWPSSLFFYYPPCLLALRLALLLFQKGFDSEVGQGCLERAGSASISASTLSCCLGSSGSSRLCFTAKGFMARFCAELQLRGFPPPHVADLAQRFSQPPFSRHSAQQLSHLPLALGRFDSWSFHLQTLSDHLGLHTSLNRSGSLSCSVLRSFGCESFYLHTLTVRLAHERCTAVHNNRSVQGAHLFAVRSAMCFLMSTTFRACTVVGNEVGVRFENGNRCQKRGALRHALREDTDDVAHTQPAWYTHCI